MADLHPSPEPRPRSSRWLAALRDLGVAALVFAVAWWLLAPADIGRREEDLYGDETCWVAISILHTDQLVHGTPPVGAELDPPRWQGGGRWARGAQRTAFGYPSPCLPKLIWGAALAEQGFHEASPYVFTVFLQHDLETGRAARELLQPALPIARRVVLAFACAATALLFLVSRAALPGAWGWLVATLTCALWCASPIVRGTVGDARTDFFMLAFALGALALALGARDALAGRRGEPARWLAGLGLGLLAGLAVSSKLDGGLVLVCVPLWVLLLGLGGGREKGRLRATLPALLLAGAAACGVFWALNPRLWAEPIGGVVDILARWHDLFDVFQHDWAVRSGTAVGGTPAESVALFLDRTLHRDEPWRALTGLPGGGVLLLGGLGVLVLRAAVGAPGAGGGPRDEPARVLLVFVLVLVVGSALWLPIDWPRYYLPAAPALALLQALALVALLRGVTELVRRRRAA